MQSQIDEGLQVAAPLFGIDPTATGILVATATIQLMIAFFIISPLGGMLIFKGAQRATERAIAALFLFLMFNVLMGGGFFLLKYQLKLTTPDNSLALFSLMVALVVTTVFGLPIIYLLSLKPESLQATLQRELDELNSDVLLPADVKRQERLKKREDYQNRPAR